MTVDGVDYPVCAQEDCSDVVQQTGVWYSKSRGQWLLELGETCTGSIPAVCSAPTYPIIP
ncbi:MAG: First [Mycobacterium sp.]|nr:First [Mycobacterium sp.]